jgi:hypothetical protein
MEPDATAAEVIPPDEDIDTSGTTTEPAGPTTPDDRLADLRRRRTELVDVLAETLLDHVLKAPLGMRRMTTSGGASV